MQVLTMLAEIRTLLEIGQELVEAIIKKYPEDHRVYKAALRLQRTCEVLTNGVSMDTLESISKDCQTQIQVLYIFIAREHLGLT